MSRAGILLLLVAFVAGLGAGLGPHETQAGPAWSLYWSGSSSGQAKIFRTSVDTPMAQPLFDTPAVAYDIAVDVGESKVFWVIESATATTSYIARTDFDGSNLQFVAYEAADHIRGVALDRAAEMVYWTAKQTGAIRRVGYTGGSAQTIVSGRANPESIAVDADGGKVYWTELAGSSSIWRANLAGGGVEQLQSGYDATGLALNTVIGQMYWVHAGEVYGAPMTPAGFVNTPPGENFSVRDITTDMSTNRLYIIDGTKILRTTEKALPEQLILSPLENPTALELGAIGVGGTAALTGVRVDGASGLGAVLLALAAAAGLLALSALAGRCAGYSLN